MKEINLKEHRNKYMGGDGVQNVGGGESTERKVSWCFTPGQSVRLYQTKAEWQSCTKRKKEQKVDLIPKNGHNFSKI